MFGFFVFQIFKCFSISDFREILLQIRAYLLFLAKLTYCNSTYVNIIDVNSKGQVISERNFGVFFPNNSQNFCPSLQKKKINQGEIRCLFGVFFLHILEVRAELLKNIYIVGFLENLRGQNFFLELLELHRCEL